MPSSVANDLITIIGGGLIGLSIAHELARKGKSVEILSRNRNEAAGFVAAGMLAPHAEGLTNNLLNLGEISLQKIPEWIARIEIDSGIKCGLNKCGIIVPFLSTSLRKSYPTANFGRPLNRTELEKEIPGIETKWNEALLFEEDGQIDNRRQLMRGLEKVCVELGVSFREGIEVLEIIYKNNTFSGIKVKNAEGAIEIYKSSQAVLCSGAWSNQLFKEIPIFPVKGQMMSLQAPKKALKRILFGPGTYMVPREDGLIVVGATSEKQAEFQEGLTPSGQKELHEGINSLLPRASHWPQMERWWGFRPCTPDELPILGTTPINGLWIATGHYRNGVLLAAITAELISKSICNCYLSDEEKIILEDFSLKRFIND